MKKFHAEEYARRESVVGGWPAGITSYRIGATYHCKVDNLSPGAIVARGSGATLAEAEAKAIERARTRFEATRRMSA